MNKESLTQSTILKVIKNNKLMIVGLLITIIGSILAVLIPPQILRKVVDNNLVNKELNGLLLLAILYLVVIVLDGIFNFIKEAIITILGQRIIKELRVEMMVKLERLETSYFSNNSSGEILSRFTNDIDAVNSMFTSGFVDIFIDSFKIIGIIISIWIFSFELGIVTLILIPVIYIITRVFQSKMLKTQMENRRLVSKVNNHISESVKNIEMIKVYSKEKYMEDSYINSLMDNYKTMDKVNFFDSIYSPTIQIIRAIIIGIIVILSAGDFNYLGITLGMIAATIDLISNIFEPIDSLGMELQSLQQSIAGFKRVDEFYKEPEDNRKDNNLKAEDIIPFGKEINLAYNNVTFNYEKGSTVLKDIDLGIKKKEKVTFVGRTGVGKSTLFKLSTGILKPTKGSITINGVDVYDIPNSEKRKIFGYVDQRFHIINGTVKDQVTLRDDSITDKEVKEAVEFVGLLEYINSLEDGLYTEVKNDSLFSQGQKQLLAIARAIVTKPQILILDEITANLDSVTEKNIVEVLQKASEGRTILSISHRLSSINAKDTVVVIEDGKIKSKGKMEEVISKDKWFSKQRKLEQLTWNQ